MTNSKSLRRALLTSALALVMCASMLVGTTFAWFTDSASAAVNTIQSGTLDVVLEMWNGEKWVSAENESLGFVNNDGNIMQNVLWEPGATYKLPKLRVRNNGNLALKYKVVLTGINGDAKLNEAIEWTIDEYVALGTEQKLGAGQHKEFIISGHMMESAGNEYQNLTIDNIAIRVIAAQDTVEFDSNNNTYDSNAQYPAVDFSVDAQTYYLNSAADLVAFAKEVNENGNNFAGKTILLTGNVDLTGIDWEPIGQTGAGQFQGTFDGRNHTISNLSVDSSAETGEYYASGLFGWVNTAVIKNVRVDGATVEGHHFVGVIAGYAEALSTCTISNCHVSNATVTNTHANSDACGDKTGVIVGYAGNAVTKIVNCSASDCIVTGSRDAGQIAGAAMSSSIIGCSASNVTVTAAGDCIAVNVNNALIGLELT